jgi:hypothetical protein
MGSMARTFPLPDFNSSYTITHRNFVRIGDKHFFRKNHYPTFYQICTRKKHLNVRSSLIKHDMIMNYTPLDSSFQCASSELKNFTSLFSFKRNSQKSHIFAYFWLPHQQMGSMAGTFPLPDFNSSYTVRVWQFYPLVLPCVVLHSRHIITKTIVLLSCHNKKEFRVR